MSYTFTTQYSSDPVAPGVEPGAYYATCVSAEEKQDSKGNWGMKVRWQFTYNGKQREYGEWYSYAQNMQWKVERLLAAVGHEFEAGQTFNFGPNLILGKKAWVLMGKAWRADKNRLQSSVIRALHWKQLPDGVTIPGRPFDEQEMFGMGLNPDGTDPYDKRTQEALAGVGAATDSSGDWGNIGNEPHGNQAAPQGQHGYQTPQHGYQSAQQAPQGAHAAPPQSTPAPSRQAQPGQPQATQHGNQAGGALPHEQEDDIPF